MIEKIKKLLEYSNEDKYWKGKAYRSDSGYIHDINTTAGDVVRYEQDELGNNYGIGEEELIILDKYPAKDIIWVTKSIERARRYYGDAKLINVDGYKIIAYDNEGGYLVLKEKQKG